MEISNPRRILAVCLEGSTQQLSQVIKAAFRAQDRQPPLLRATGFIGADLLVLNTPSDLTGSHPEPASSTLAGTTHNLQLTTPYYSVEVPIWLDVISTPSEWADTFLSNEAKEVLQVIGGVVVIFALPGASTQIGAGSQTPFLPTPEQAKALIAHVGRVVRDGLGGWEWDGVGLGIGVGDLGTDDPDVLDEWEDACADVGLEFVHARATQAPVPSDGSDETRNEFGEKTGIARALEALQSNDWQGFDAADGEDEDEFGLGELDGEGAKNKGDKAEDEGDGDDLNPESLNFGFDRADFEGLKKAIWSVGHDNDEDFMDELGEASKAEGGTASKVGDGELDDEDVQKLERMFVKLQAVRDQSAGLPEEQRKRLAKRAVTDVMKEL